MNHFILLLLLSALNISSGFFDYSVVSTDQEEIETTNIYKSISSIELLNPIAESDDSHSVVVNLKILNDDKVVDQEEINEIYGVAYYSSLSDVDSLKSAGQEYYGNDDTGTTIQEENMTTFDQESAYSYGTLIQYSLQILTFFKTNLSILQSKCISSYYYMTTEGTIPDVVGASVLFIGMIGLGYIGIIAFTHFKEYRLMHNKTKSADVDFDVVMFNNANIV